ncbi:TonB-dependent receptor [Flavobacterium sp. N3904]|uniref:TonB-dependent receptor n=1 Tax=Flavobacterium sp. N3904 TaxID=2986835 RepID=UPI0022255591|nr:TonB-dependent receptor [Flavobacterium sp. N3904]
MKKMKNWLLSGLLFLVVSTVFSQGKITGVITDGEGFLPGANISIKGTSDGTLTDYNGKFTINTSVKTGQLVITYLGFDSKTVSFTVADGATTDLGAIVLKGNSNELDEIVITSGVVDIAKDRKTPVAVSTIKAAEIQEKLGTLEFPEILKTTPSVYATKGGGGYGDSRINIRGFSQTNVAVMVNGVPINDMENGAVFWSNWAGLSDVTTAMQVQRGLGSSKLAIASVGGTINIMTKSSEKDEGGSVATTFGNANYFKYLATYSTGRMENGFSTSVLFGQTRGDGYVDGTEFRESNYYIGMGYDTKDNKHNFQFSITGAPQWHNQRSASPTIATYLKYGSNGNPATRYNSDWGYLNGEEFNMRRNFYHKPIASINWDYNINETTKLSTVLYGSWGRGGGSNGTGGIRGANFLSNDFRTADGLVDFDKIQAYNSGQTVMINGVAITRTTTGTTGLYENSAYNGATKVPPTAPAGSSPSTSGISRISSFNSHDWYGGVIDLNKKFSKNLTFDIGLDLRTYTGMHYQNVNTLLGGDVYVDTFDVNNPNRTLTGTYPVSPTWNPFQSISSVEKINYYNDGDVNWYGVFTQLEYSQDNLTAFVQGAVSQQGFKRVDYFKYPAGTALADTDFENVLGGNVKGGANYNFTEQHNAYVNAGYYSKQPFFNVVYPNNASIVNPLLVNEKITGVEGGYGFRSRYFNANVNLYYTSWADRFQRNNDNAADNPGGYYDFAGIKEVHTGFEFEGNSKISDKLRINAMFSMGDWEYKGNVLSERFNAQNEPIGGGKPTTLYLDGVKVGDAAQLTASLGATYQVLRGVEIDANYNYNDNVYASISPINFTSPDNKGSLEIPAYGLLDAGFSYTMFVGKDKDKTVFLRLNVNNVMDKVYIAESKTNIFADDNIVPNDPSKGTYSSTGRTYNGVADANQVFFGFGRTWNFSMRYNF